MTRRTYFKRIERWMKPGKARKPEPPRLEPGLAAVASNVVPFPIRAGHAGRPAFTALRGVGMA
ncbi:hypothetical protein [Methylobacterium sp. NEAU K]|uniref:hypothetical protein n=1 Tax=Methylobacterium sp. NEAU K TaxID=3064946 RepID=UPI002733EA6E|nr:hypothetical protein [Methylobacterium sp. NEAU K]MDP4004090.1 hypothetical protein [Methylobacterium sp. NEAU K]